MKNKQFCPCGSKKLLIHCCQRYISGAQLAPIPEALMRSRYTAYTQANISYIQQTMCGAASHGYNPVEALKWAKNVKWLGLTVVNSTQKKHNIGYVEFVAHYSLHGKAERMHEKSEFHYIKDRWYYVAGEILPS